MRSSEMYRLDDKNYSGSKHLCRLLGIKGTVDESEHAGS